jgi:hypothetical protein
VVDKSNAFVAFMLSFIGTLCDLRASVHFPKDFLWSLGLLVVGNANSQNSWGN